MNVEKFIEDHTRFADKLREVGEVKAAEAVETVIKTVRRGLYDDPPEDDCKEA